MKWTSDQKLAIETKGGRVLVSAAAGSGKTAVLVEKVKELMTDKTDPVSADKFLIATFSRAAAFEMRERLETTVAGLIAKNPNDMALRKQKILLQRSQISTIHSFCMKILKDNFAKIGITPNFRIGNENESKILESDAISEVLEEFYQNSDEDFHLLVEFLSSGRDDKSLEKTVLLLYNFLRGRPDYEEWFQSSLELYNEAGKFSESKWGKIITEHTKEALDISAELVKNATHIIGNDEIVADAYLESFLLTKNALEKLREKIENMTWNEIKISLEKIPFSRLGALRTNEDENLEEIKTKVTAIRNLVKKTLSDLSDKIWISTQEQAEIDMIFLKKRYETLFEVLRRYDEVFSLTKNQRNIVDFSDLEHLALAVLWGKDESGKTAKTSVAKEISKKYDMILVDEYQDTNEVQDMIFKLVSRNEKNLFLVGDIKQSIYAFRGAEPSLFAKKHENSHRFKDEKIFPAVITLANNFRSREGICTGINEIFSSIMSKKIGGVNYIGDELLYPAASYPKRKNQVSTHVVFADYKQNSEMSASDFEGELVASKISKMISEKFMVTDKKTADLRPCRYEDFAILVRSKTNVQSYEKALIKAGVPLWSDFSKQFFKSKEIMHMLAMISIVDNPLRDVDFVAVLMSPMYMFSADKVAEIRMNFPKESIYRAVLLSAKTDEKLQKFIDDLSELRKFSSVAPVDDLLHKILEITKYDLLIYGYENAEQRHENITFLISQAKAFEKAGYHNLSAFNRIMQKQLEEDAQVHRDATLPDGENLVKIMTMHRSKGLEFPICFVVDCSKRFYLRDLYEKNLFHAQLGIAGKFRDHELKTERQTLPHEALKIQMKNELLSEEMRILYVALTRAKEELFLVSTISDFEKKLRDTLAKRGGEEKVSPFLISGASSFSDWILNAVANNKASDFLKSKYGLELGEYGDGGYDILLWDETGEHFDSSDIQQEDETGKPDEKLRAKIKNRLEFSYEFEEMTRKETKHTVSDLAEQKNQKSSGEIHLKKPKFLLGGELTGAEKGNIYHTYMEFADYKKALISPKDELLRMVSQNHISKDEEKVIKTTKISKFFESDLGARILNADKLHKELKFISIIDKEEAENSAMLQGIIDCVFIENGIPVVVDYKTDFVKSESELREKYREQVLMYRDVCEEIFGVPVKEVYLYSFFLDKAILL